jgi:hypothetical protein
LRYLILLMAVFLSGCNFLDAIPTPSPDGEKEQKEEKKTPAVSEDEVWKELALSIAKGVHRDTDDVVLTAENLKTMGRLTDISRVDEFRTKLTKIDETNRDAIAAKVSK